MLLTDSFVRTINCRIFTKFLIELAVVSGSPVDARNMSQKRKVAIIGSGFIGHNFATLFADCGYPVCLYDVSEERLNGGKQAVFDKLDQLHSEGLRRNESYPVDDAKRCVTTALTLADCLKGAFYVQECTLEDLALKKKVFQELDELATDDMILASSTSALKPSTFTADLKHRANCVVVHPVNPPIYCPLTEIIPAPWTSAAVVDAAYQLMTDIKQRPIRLTREVDGFAVNRLQYSIMGEAWRMIKDGLISPADIDLVMSEGLGLRYAFLGPFEVLHMNADGIVEHNKRYGPGVERVLNSCGPVPDFLEPETLNRLRDSLEQRIPVNKLSEHRQWREKRLAALAKLKKSLEAEKPPNL